MSLTIKKHLAQLQRKLTYVPMVPMNGAAFATQPSPHADVTTSAGPTPPPATGA